MMIGKNLFIEYLPKYGLLNNALKEFLQVTLVLWSLDIKDSDIFGRLYYKIKKLDDSK